MMGCSRLSLSLTVPPSDWHPICVYPPLSPAHPALRPLCSQTPPPSWRSRCPWHPSEASWAWGRPPLPDRPHLSPWDRRRWHGNLSHLAGRPADYRNRCRSPWWKRASGGRPPPWRSLWCTRWWRPERSQHRSRPDMRRPPVRHKLMFTVWPLWKEWN